MDIEVLRGYAEIIESGSITAAAKKLYVTQATLSMQLKSLEKELGTVLLIRSAHRLELTEAGKALYKRAKCISALDDTLRNEIHDIGAGIGGTVRIGISSAEGFSVCGGLAAAFLKAHPDIHCEIYEKPDFELLDMAASGAAGAVFVRTPCTVSADTVIMRFSPEPMTVLYDPSVYNIEGEGAIPITALSGMRVVIRREYLRLAESVFRERAGKQKDMPLIMTAAAADSIPAVLAAASEGIGAGIVPQSAVPVGTLLAVRDIEEKGLYTERIAAAGKKGSLTSAEKLFLEYIRKEMK